MNKANNNGLKKAEAKVETILEQATRLPLAIRRSIVLGVLALVLLLIALVIAGIASCSGNSSREALVQETPAPLNDGEAGGAPAASATAAAESVSGYVQPQTTAGEDGVTTLEDEEDPSRQQEGDEAVPEDTPLPTEDTPAPTDAPTPEPTSQYTTLKKHDKSEEVTQLQNRLMELGYLEIDEPTDYFGSSTAYAVQLFQRQHNLTQDGVAGPTTQTLLYSKDAEKYCLKEGAEGRDVKQLQQQLCELGYLDEKEIDHVYGPTTISAIKTFQKRNKLTDDGMAGETPWKSFTPTMPGSLPPCKRRRLPLPPPLPKPPKIKRLLPPPNPIPRQTRSSRLPRASWAASMCWGIRDRTPLTAPVLSTGAFVRQGSIAPGSMQRAFPTRAPGRKFPASANWRREICFSSSRMKAAV